MYFNRKSFNMNYSLVDMLPLMLVFFVLMAYFHFLPVLNVL